MRGPQASLNMGASFAIKAVAILSILAAVCVLLTYFMYRRMRQTGVRLQKARGAAEEAARAAAMAAPGGIDPDIVLAILNQGLPPTLDNVYQLAQRREGQRSVARAAASRSVG